MSPDRTDGFPRPAGRRSWERMGVAVAALCVIWFYAFTVKSAGGFERDYGFAHYRSLVDGFLDGQMALKQLPDPRLVALRDPYDPALNADLRLPDASYYRGKYYIYFGPMPALALLLPYRLLTGTHLAQGVGVLVFCWAGLFAAGAVWLKLRARYFPGSAWWMAGLGILLLGFGTHLLALARRPDMWEMPIAASFAATMCAMLCVGRSLRRGNDPIWLGAGSLCLGLALAARPTALLASGMLLPPLVMLGRKKGDLRRAFAAAALPAGMIVMALLAYNYARFGTPLEFGQKYQLTSLGEVERRHFGFEYALHNLRLYFVWPVSFTADWPWIAARPLPAGPPGYYAGEELYCLAGLFPFLWLALGTFGLSAPMRRARDGVLLAQVVALAAVFLAMGSLVLSFFSATERYMVEFVPALMLLALVGALVVEESCSAGLRVRLVRPVLAVTALVTIAAGILISFDYHQRSMRRTDPAAWTRWDARLQRVARMIGVVPPPAFRHLAEVEFGPPRPGLIDVLAATSDGNAAARILVERGKGSHVRLGVERADRWIRWSDWFEADASGSTSLGIYLPELLPANPPAGATSPWNWRIRNLSMLTVNGRPVLTLMGEPAGHAGQTLMADSSFSGRRPVFKPEPFWPDEDIPALEPGWIMEGRPPGRAGARIPLLATSGSAGGGLLLLEAVGPGVHRLVKSEPEGGETMGPDFVLDAVSPVRMEIEHAPLWPWSQRERDQQPVAILANGFTVWRTLLPGGKVDPDGVHPLLNPAGIAQTPGKADGWRLVAPSPARSGEGTLRLRLLLPRIPAGTAEPLATLGVIGAADIVGLRHVGNGRWVVFLDRWGTPLRESQPVTLDFSREHEFRITHPSFAGKASTNEVAVEIDGVAVLRAPSDLKGYSAEQLQVGRNSLGATSCGPEFTGWLLSARWLAAGAVTPAAAR